MSEYFLKFRPVYFKKSIEIWKLVYHTFILLIKWHSSMKIKGIISMSSRTGVIQDLQSFRLDKIRVLKHKITWQRLFLNTIVHFNYLKSEHSALSQWTGS